jgi:antitoxin ParD1/3/4
LANPAKPERAMATMNISLPDDLRDFVEQQVREKSYSSSSEYLRELIRRQRDTERFRGLILEGLNSGPGEVIDDAFFDSLRERVRSRA